MPDPGANSQTNLPEYSVSEISFALKRTIEDAYGYVRIRGEISGYRGPHSSGHAYFALKDEKARIEAVVWRGVFGRLRFKPEEGMEVVATGKLTTYPGSSKYQIVIDALEPAGVGALMALLEERRKKLAAEGLFDEARKKRPPFLPRRIGVVTSPTGAVIRDILHRLGDRFPVDVLVWPVRVQGETSAAEVAAAIAGFNALLPDGPVPRPDLLIVARGGGSLEDLWSFNEEAVVRAAAASKIPLISAVGHETDWTLIDHAADLRAPTPTGAAEIAVPVRADLLATVDDIAGRLRGAVRRLADARRSELRAAERGLPQLRDLMALPRQRTDMAAGRLVQALVVAVERKAALAARAAARLSAAALKARLARSGDRLADLSGRLNRASRQIVEPRRTALGGLSKLMQSLSYRSVLARGYALVRDANGTALRAAAAIAPGAVLDIEFHDGRVPAVAGPGPKRRPAKRSKDDQSDLFGD